MPKRRGFFASMLPRPPPVRTTTDFVVIVFVVTVATALMLSMAFITIAEFIHPQNEHAQFISALTDTFKTITGALIGFVAGRSHGRSEMRDEEAFREEQSRDDAG